MKHIILTIFLFLSLSACTYRSDRISDIGEWVIVPAGESVEGYNNINGKIYWGYITDDFTDDEKIEADIETFCVCKGSEYAKDKNHIYYPQNIVCYDGVKENEETGEYEGFGGSMAKKIILKGAKPSQFKYIGNGFAVSVNRMYHNGEVIEWNDSIANPDL